MKTNLILLFLLAICVKPLQAQFTVNLDAGELTGPGGNSSSVPMQVDNTSPSSNGSLLLLVDLGSSETASTMLTAGEYVSGTDIIVAAGGFNTNGGTNETLNTLQASSLATQGDDLALFWFPQITLAQYESGTLTIAGDYFGIYDPNGGNPDGGDLWTVPGSGSQISLDFYTTNSDGGGSQAPVEGNAVFQVEDVPEPSTYALFLLGLGLPLILWAQHRRER